MVCHVPPSLDLLYRSEIVVQILGVTTGTSDHILRRFSIGWHAIAGRCQPALRLLARDGRTRLRDRLPAALQRRRGRRPPPRLACRPACLQGGEGRRVGGARAEPGPPAAIAARPPAAWCAWRW